MDKIEAAAAAVKSRAQALPQTVVILGSGLASVAQSLEGFDIPYSEIPHMPQPTVQGHSGILRVTPRALFFMGRFHHYEGRELPEIVFPVDLVKALGLKNLIVTNAAGGVRGDLEPGDLVLIQDHINLMGINPLRGPHLEAWGPRFPDMTRAYDAELRATAQKVCQKLWAETLKEGVYGALAGPNYETPAEVRMLGTLGVDLVGMSTVPEVLEARFLGLKVLGISCVTNKAAGLGAGVLNHKEVVEAGLRVQSRLTELILALLAQRDFTT